MPALTRAPSPQQFANAWTKGFAAAVRDAAGRDGRLSKTESNKVEGRYADNVKNFFERTGQKSASVNSLIARGHAYAEANGHRVAGGNNRMSLLEARNLPTDLKDDFMALRGRGVSTPSNLPSLAEVQSAVTNFDMSPANDGMTSFEVEAMTGDLAAIKAALVADPDGLYDGTPSVFTGRTGTQGVDEFFWDAEDFISHGLDDQAEGDAAYAAMDALRDVFSMYGDDVQLLEVTSYMGRQSWDTTVLVLGEKSGSPVVVKMDYSY